VIISGFLSEKRLKNETVLKLRRFPGCFLFSCLKPGFMFTLSMHPFCNNFVVCAIPQMGAIFFHYSFVMQVICTGRINSKFLCTLYVKQPHHCRFFPLCWMNDDFYDLFQFPSYVSMLPTHLKLSSSMSLTFHRIINLAVTAIKVCLTSFRCTMFVATATLILELDNKKDLLEMRIRRYFAYQSCNRMCLKYIGTVLNWWVYVLHVLQTK
jgi:hypothetical protein